MSEYWNTEDMRKWKHLTQTKQQEYYDSPHIVKCRECKLSDTSNLKKIIRFALFDVSEKEPLENLTDKQLKDINKIFDSIQRSMKKNYNVENILLSILFVLAKAGDNYVKIPVIKILRRDKNIERDDDVDNINNNNNKHSFIDFCGRVYENWKDYLKNNTLPNCILCYPGNGVYSAENGTVTVEYGISPAGKRGRKFLRLLDNASTALSVTVTMVTIAAWCFPGSSPVVAGSVTISVLTKVYATGRKIQKLVDRSHHQQSIGLRSSEARSCWLCIAGNVIGLASVGFTVIPASTAAMELARRIVSTGSRVVNAVSGTNCLINKIRELFTRRKFVRYLTDIYICENHQSEKEELLEQMCGIVKDFITEDVFHKNVRISGIPKDNSFQEVFKLFKGKEKYGLTLLNLKTVDTLTQDTAQISLACKDSDPTCSTT